MTEKQFKLIEACIHEKWLDVDSSKEIGQSFGVDTVFGAFMNALSTEDHKAFDKSLSELRNEILGSLTAFEALYKAQPK